MGVVERECGMSPENTHKLMGFLYGGFNTRRHTLEHGFCFVTCKGV